MDKLRVVRLANPQNAEGGNVHKLFFVKLSFRRSFRPRNASFSTSITMDDHSELRVSTLSSTKPLKPENASAGMVLILQFTNCNVRKLGKYPKWFFLRTDS